MDGVSDHRGDDHSGDRNGGGDHKGGQRGCAGPQESLLEALVDGLCASAETLERGLTGAR